LAGDFLTSFLPTPRQREGTTFPPRPTCFFTQAHELFTLQSKLRNNLQADLALGDLRDLLTPRQAEGISFPPLPACFLTQAQASLELHLDLTSI
jgi:hypothetical protein